MVARWGKAIVAVVVVAAVVAGCRSGDAAESRRPGLLKQAVANPYRAALRAHAGDAAPEMVAAVEAFYAARDYAMAWHDRRGAGYRVKVALDILRAADEHGLRAGSYGADDLAARASGSASTAGPDAVTRTAILDRDLTAAVLKLGQHVATGRRHPSTLHPRWNMVRTPPDVAAALLAATETGQAAAFLDRVRPLHREYRALQAALGSLREQARRGWPQVPQVTMRAGLRHAAVPAVRERLAMAGYLHAEAPADPQMFDADVTEAVTRFQAHHGLQGTGVLDRPTIAAMNVPLDRRIAEVDLNLERWRWLPDDLGTRHLLVNIPQFHLLVRESGETVMDLRVIVGKRGLETPTFSEPMREVVFSPYWHIPPSIARNETIPALARDPNYAARQNLEVVGADGELVPAGEMPWGDAQALRRLSFRQRPGSGNALGLVKFVFPNAHNVYLHDTPADALFARVGRALSHGCVRVEEPEMLAQFVLRDQPEWTMPSIVSAMRGGAERRVRLPVPLPVHIVYFTATVDSQGGLHHYPDVYGYDARSLDGPPPSRRAPRPVDRRR